MIVLKPYQLKLICIVVTAICYFDYFNHFTSHVVASLELASVTLCICWNLVLRVFSPRKTCNFSFLDMPKCTTHNKVEFWRRKLTLSYSGHKGRNSLHRYNAIKGAMSRYFLPFFPVLFLRTLNSNMWMKYSKMESHLRKEYRWFLSIIYITACFIQMDLNLKNVGPSFFRLGIFSQSVSILSNFDHPHFFAAS